MLDCVRLAEDWAQTHDHLRRREILIATSNMPKNVDFNSQRDMLSLTHRGERRLDMLVGVGDQLFHTGEKVGHDHLERGSYISLT